MKNVELIAIIAEQELDNLGYKLSGGHDNITIQQIINYVIQYSNNNGVNIEVISIELLIMITHRVVRDLVKHQPNKFTNLVRNIAL